MLAAHGLDNARVELADNSGRRAEPVVVIRVKKELQQGSAEKDAVAAAITRTLGHLPSSSCRLLDQVLAGTINALIGVRHRIDRHPAYIAYAFRNTQNPLLYGIAAIVAMMHDVLVVLGIFSILGEVRGVEIDSRFTALLTIIGFSCSTTRSSCLPDPGNSAACWRRPDVRRGGQTPQPGSDARPVIEHVDDGCLHIAGPLYLFGLRRIDQGIRVCPTYRRVPSGTSRSLFNASQLLVSWETGEIQRLWERIKNFGRTPSPAPSGR